MPSLALLDSFYRERNYNCPVYLSDLHRDAEREKRALAVQRIAEFERELEGEGV